MPWANAMPGIQVPVRAWILGCLLAMTLLGCGDDEPAEPRDPVSAVQAFYAALYIERDPQQACELLVPSARAGLTVERPPPECTEAAERIGEALSDAQRDDIERALRTPAAFGFAERAPATAEVEVASSDTSAAGLHLRLLGKTWRIDGIDPGAVDGGQPSADEDAIRSLHRWRLFSRDQRPPTSAVHPPSTRIPVPVRYDAASDATNATTPAISSGRATRPSGMRELKTPASTTPLRMPSAMRSVST